MSIFLLSFVIIKPISCFYTLEISGLIMGLQELISEEGRPVWDLEGRVGRARVWRPHLQIHDACQGACCVVMPGLNDDGFLSETVAVVFMITSLSHLIRHNLCIKSKK